jgi:hypothetical protein
MPTVDIDRITVGSIYRNSIVTNIDEEVNDLKNGKVKIRRLITLDDGMIVIEDALYDFEEIVGEYKELQYNEIDFPDISPKKKKSHKKEKKKKKKKDKDRENPPASAFVDLDNEDDDGEDEGKREAEESARCEAEEASRREAEERSRQEEKERQRHEAQEQVRREAEERARLEEARRRREEEKERRRREADEAERIKQFRENWKPQKMMAYTSDNEDKGDPVRSAWRLPEEKKFDSTLWPVKDVVLYPPNKPLPDSTRNDKNTPNGYYCYSAPSLQPGEKDTDWIPADTSDAQFLVFLPGQQPPRGPNMLVGEWCMGAPTVWPPKKEPKACTIHPPNSRPAPAANVDSEQQHGIWKIGSDFPHMDESNWNLSSVFMYDAGHEPESIDPKKPQGPWGLAPGAKPNENGVYNPEDLWFLFPGEETPADHDWDCRGIWVLDAKDCSNWIPFKEPPTTTTVHHRDKISNAKNGCCSSHQDKAIWINHPDVKASKWVPQNVFAYKKGSEPDNLDPLIPQGLWGRATHAKPDMNGRFNPIDTWYVFPGEDPPNDDEWDCKGTWALDPSENWKPYDETPQPRRFYVCPSSQLKNGKDQGSAIWRIGDGFPNSIDEDNWELLPILAYEFGDEPEDVKEKTNGLWGQAKDAEPDENGNYDPNDTWFIYPGDTPPGDGEWDCCGTWTLDDMTEAAPQWPPYRKPALVEEGPFLATIFPEKKALKESTETGKLKGMWKYTPGKKVMDAGKKPKEVLLRIEGNELNEKEAKHGGVWGYAPGAEPDTDGNYSPLALWCFAPSETPPLDSEWQRKGTWVPKELPKPTQKFSSPSNHSQSSTMSRNLQACKEKKVRVRRFPHSAWVFPDQQHAPQGEKGNLQGIWSTPPGDQPGGKLGIKYKDGEPMEVMIHKHGMHPSEADLKKTAHGKWGYHKDAQPNDRGIMDPKDIIFFPPGVDCGSNVNGEGIWTCPGAVIKETMSWKFEGDEIKHFKKTEIHFMDTVTEFATEYIKKQ